MTDSQTVYGTLLDLDMDDNRQIPMNITAMHSQSTQLLQC